MELLNPFTQYRLAVKLDSSGVFWYNFSMTAYTHLDILELPLRASNNRLQKKNVGELLATMLLALQREDYDLVQSTEVYDRVAGDNWEHEIGYALVDAGLVSIDEDTTARTPDETATQEIIAYLIKRTLISDFPDKVFRTEPSAEEILNLKLGYNDAHASTVREFMRKLLVKMWDEGEGFSGKKPFGNSGWEQPITLAMIRAKLINGEIDEDGFIKTMDRSASERLIRKAINAL